MILQGEELEFAISQYLDGQLSPDVAGVLEERLAVDSQARDLLRQYRQIHSSLSTPILEIDWDQSLRQIRQKIDPHWFLINTNSSATRQKTNRSQSFLTTSWKLKLGRFTAPLAMAASVLIAFTTITVFVAHSRREAPVATVNGPQVEAPSGPVVAEVSIGPAPSMASGSRLSHEDIIDRPSIVLIDRADNPAPDNDSIY